MTCRIELLVVLLAACGGAQKATPESEMKRLAATLDADLAEVARIVHVYRADCPELAAQLKARFAKMQPSVTRAREVQADPTLATELTTELRAYDAKAAGYSKSIDRDFTVDAPCARDTVVRDVMVTMPTL